MTKQELIQVFKDVGHLLRRTQWIQGAYAHKRLGLSTKWVNRVNPLDPTACAFCISGAICKIVNFNPELSVTHPRFNLKNYKKAEECLDLFRATNDIRIDIVDWNDHEDRTEDEIFSSLRKVIESLENE